MPKIPNAVVESPEFKKLVRQCRLVDNTFVIPSKKKIGGELLNINFENIKEINKTNLLKEAAVFGVKLIGDTEQEEGIQVIKQDGE
jgi:hypothetical protein